MKLGIMQPYFFPYLGYFDLIHCTDQWIVFDTPQYIRHGWMNRNRILHPNKDWQYIIAPLAKHEWNAPIKDVNVQPGRAWRDKILGQLGHYRKRAPHYEPTLALVSSCLADEETSLARLNAGILAQICRHLGLPFNYRFLSELNLDLGDVNAPGDWALKIAQAAGASEYVNPPGGAGLFDPARFAESGITLTIRNLPTFEYGCRGREFIPHLSIIDVLMWNPIEAVVGHLRRHLSADPDPADLVIEPTADR